MRRLIYLFFLFGFTLIGAAQTPSKAVETTYTIDAIRYASMPGVAVSNLVAGAKDDRKIETAMIYWLVRGGGRTILVDSGFYRPKFLKQWPIRGFQSPDVTLAKLGLKPSDITDVILTHMHWDHADGVDLFPRAKVWIQREEYVYYTGEAWQENGSHGGIDPEDVLSVVKLNTEGRVSLIAGDDRTILPGIRGYTGGKHTWASQFLTVTTKTGTVVLASDNVFLYENLEKHAPIAQTLDAPSNLRAQDRMRRLASEPRLIVPGHDMLEFDRFPTIADGIVEIR